MSSYVNVDDRKVLEALSSLSPKKLNSAYNKGIKKALEPIVKETKRNLRKSGVKNVNKPYVSPKTHKVYKSMLQGVKASADAGNKENPYGKAHIMGEFRLRWMEKGTVLRKTKKGASRGRIAPRWFFKPAVESKQEESMRTLDDNIRESIIKLWEKS